MMRALTSTLTLLSLIGTPLRLSAQPDDGLNLIPDTPAGSVYRAFVSAYNEGLRESLAKFVSEHYAPGTDIEGKTDDWLVLYYKYGPVRLHGLSISKDHDLEMWLYGKITRSWIAVELILNEDTKHVRAVGILHGEGPVDAPSITIPEHELPQHLDTYLRVLTDEGYFAGTVLLAHKGQPIYERAFGLADQANGIPVRVDTKFQLVSITKAFTAVAIAQLAEQGEVSFDDPITTYVPEYPKDIGEQITIHHLLTHTSGIELDEIPDFVEAKWSAENSEALLNVHLRHIDSLRTDGRFTPPMKYDYSNEGYDLAGLIVERVSKQSLLGYLTKHILEPAGMLDTGRFPVDPQQENIAIGYTHYLDRDYIFSEQEVPNRRFLEKTLFGSSGLYSTVGDLNRFANALFYSSELLAPTTRDLVQAAQVERGPSETYGYGFTRIIHDGVLSIGHGGSMPGASTEFRYFPASEHTVVVLASKRTIAITISNYIRDLVVNAP